MSPASSEVRVSPPVLRWARATSGLRPEVASARAGLEVDRLTAWEAGEGQPSYSSLRRLAHVYHRPLSVFLLQKPPEEAGLPTDFRVLGEGERDETLSEETLLAIRRTRRVQETVSRLSEKTSGGEHRPGLRTSVTRDPEASAAKVAREMHAYDLDPPHFNNPYAAWASWRRLVELHGILALQFPMPVRDVRGFSLAGPGVPTLVVNKSDGVRARIFTLFHELAHLLKNEAGVCDLGGEFDGGSAPPLEVFCNAFAGAFLVPQVSLRTAIAPIAHENLLEEDNLRRLSNRFQVSERVVLRRLLTCGFVSSGAFHEADRVQRYRGAKARSTRQEEVRRNIPLERVSEYGTPFIDLVLASAREGNLTWSEVTDALDVRLKHLPGIEEHVARSHARTE